MWLYTLGRNYAGYCHNFFALLTLSVDCLYCVQVIQCDFPPLAMSVSDG